MGGVVVGLHRKTLSLWISNGGIVSFAARCSVVVFVLTAPLRTRTSAMPRVQLFDSGSIRFLFDHTRPPLALATRRQHVSKAGPPTATLFLRGGRLDIDLLHETHVYHHVSGHCPTSDTIAASSYGGRKTVVDTEFHDRTHVLRIEGGTRPASGGE